MKNDMTQGVEWKNVVLFSLPIMAGNLLQQLYNTVDGVVVGRYVSQNALAAVGSCATLAFVFLAIAMGFSNGCGVLVAQLFGAKRMRDMKSAVSTSFIVMAAMGVVFSIGGCVGARWLLSGLMNVEEGELLELGTLYFSIYAVGLVFQFFYNIVSYILRAVGDSRATLYFLCVTAVMNLALDLLFVVGFNWGVAGAAVATVVAQLVCALVSFVYMTRCYAMFRFSKGEFVFNSEKCGECLRLGVPTAIQQCVVSFGNVFIQRLVNSFGNVFMAAYTVGVRMENYIMIPALGFNVGMSTFTAQNVGAKRIDRVQRGWRKTVLISFGVCALVSVSAYIFAPQIAGLFALDAQATAYAVEYIHFFNMCTGLFAVYIVTCGLLQGSGDVMYVTFCSLASLGLRVAVAYAFAYVFDMGYSSCWKALPIGWGLCTAMAFGRYFSGAWKKKSVVRDEKPLGEEG